MKKIIRVAVVLILGFVGGVQSTAYPLGLTIMVNGWRGDRYHSLMEAMMSFQGYATCQVDLPQNGTPDDFAEFTAQKIEHCLLVHPYQRDRVMVWGMSLGGYSIARAASEFISRVGTMVLEFPANYPDAWRGRPLEDVIGVYGPHEELVVWRHQPLRCGSGENSAVESICGFRRAGGRVLVIVGGQDELVPEQTGRNYAEVGRGQMVIFPDFGHGHATEVDARKLTDLIFQWIVLP